MIGQLWAALAGFALGSIQLLTIDWMRNRSRNRRQLRFLRAELRRLAGFQATFQWQLGEVPQTDTVPNPPTITPGYTSLIQGIDFWLTDEHSDDNTQQGLIDIVDGCAILQRYADATHECVDKAGAATSAEEKNKWRDRATENALAYDKEHSRWVTIMGSAREDVQRRLIHSTSWRQAIRTLRPMPQGTNPPPLPPVKHIESLPTGAAEQRTDQVNE